MIKLTFKNWELCAYRAEPPAYQFDDGTVGVVVDGDIPSGWTWELLIAYGDNLDIAVMERSDDGLTVALSAQQLAYAGYYTLQLRATLGTLVKHSAPVMVYIGGSLSGDAHWPEIPTAFSQAVARAEAAIADAQDVQTAVEQSEAAAEQSASDAAGSATAAAQSATTAAQSATDAGAYATSAAGSAESAAQSATAAAESTTAAEGAVSHYPRISTTTGNWEVWDAATGAWTDTGVRADSPVQDVQVDGQSVLTGGIAAVSSASVTKNGMTGNSPAWTPVEQLAARQRLGMNKEWVLVGTIYGDETDRGNIDTGVDVDLSGYTELYAFVRGVATSNISLRSNAAYLIASALTTTRKFTAARFQDTDFGFDCVLAKYSGSETNTAPADNATGYCNYDGTKLSDITSISFSSPQNVTSCDVQIYAR